MLSVESQRHMGDQIKAKLAYKSYLMHAVLCWNFTVWIAGQYIQ